MLALERRATLRQTATGGLVGVKSQPFGGAVRIHDIDALRQSIGEFRFDSEESRWEQDFRIFVQALAWGATREFCLRHLNQQNDPVLETDPTRELTEEFAEALEFRLNPDQYTYQAVGTIVEEQPAATEHIHARGYPTARVYRIFETHLLDPALISLIMKNSESLMDHQLAELALGDFRNGGLGKANAVLVLPFEEISAFYGTIPVEGRNQPVAFHNHQLDETVAAVLNDVTVSKYQRL